VVLIRVVWESVFQSKGAEESGGGWVRLSRAVSGRGLDCLWMKRGLILSCCGCFLSIDEDISCQPRKDSKMTLCR